MTVRKVFNPEEYWNSKHSMNYPALFQPTELAIKALPLFCKHPGSIVLEIGCGRSGDAFFFASKGLKVFAIDVSIVALREMQKAGYGINSVSFLQSDISQGLPLLGCSVDAVYSRLSLHYFQDNITRKIFSEIYRVLRTTGCFVMSVKSAEENLLKEEIKINGGAYNQHPKHFFTEDYTKSLIVNYCQAQVVSSKIFSGEKLERKTFEVFAAK